MQLIELKQIEIDVRVEASQKTSLGPKRSREMKLSQIHPPNVTIHISCFSRLFVFSAAAHEHQTGKLEPPAFVWRKVRCCHQFVKMWPIPGRRDQTGAQVRLLTDDLPKGDSSCSSKVQTWFIIVLLGISAASFLFVWQRAEDHHDIITLINMVDRQQCLKQRDKGVFRC